jgi:hypothetical protein
MLRWPWVDIGAAVASYSTSGSILSDRRVEMLEFDPSVRCGKLPIGLGMVGIGLPRGGFVDEGLFVSKREALWNGEWFILKPDFDRPAGKLPRDCGARQLSEVFLKASCASRSLCGCTGRTDMLLKFSFLSSLPTLRSCR